MFHRLFSSLTMLICAICIAAQQPYNAVIMAPKSPPLFFQEFYSVPLQKKAYSGIDGSPFIINEWQLAQVKIKDQNEYIDSLYLKMDVYSGKIHFLNGNREEFETIRPVELIRIIDSNSEYFKKVFITLDKEKGSAFYEILARTDDLQLLKEYTTQLWEYKPLGSDTQRKFELKYELFFYSNGVLYQTNKNCNTARQLFSNHEVVIKFISKNNLHCNKENDMKKLMEFYSELITHPVN